MVTFGWCRFTVINFFSLNNNSDIQSILLITRSTFDIFRLLNVDESIVYGIPTIAKLRALFDNYELDATDKEVITTHEKNEENDFINAVLDTKVMKTAMQFLHKKGEHEQTFNFCFFFSKNALYWQVWLNRTEIANLIYCGKSGLTCIQELAATLVAQVSSTVSLNCVFMFGVLTCI